MAKSQLLTNAMTSVKELKQIALMTAKLQLEETFQPSIQRLVTARLSEEDEMEDEGEFDVDIEFSTPEEEVPSEEPAPEMGSLEGEPDGDEAPTEEMPEEEPEMDQELEALKRELAGLDDAEEDEDVGMEDDMEDEFPVEEGEEENWSDPIDESEDFEMSDDEITETLMSMFNEEEDVDLEENADGAGAYEDNATVTQRNHESYKRLKKENAKLKSELNETLRAVTILKAAINETNLLNSKLQFMTRTFKAFPLTEAQQDRIIDSFDRAKTVREAKLVYTTIVESLNKKPKATKRMNEGSASKTIKAINPTKADRRNLNEGSDIVAKWQVLAGIKEVQY